MNKSWDIGELRQYVEKSFSQYEASQTIHLINSIGRSQRIFDYHNRLAQDAFQEFPPRHFILPRSRSNRDAWNAACLQSEANFIACVSTLINTFEAFGKLLVQLNLTNSPKSLFRAIKGLRKSDLRTALESTTQSDAFKFLRAFNNTVKHHQLINHQTTISFTESRHGGRIDAFAYHNDHTKERESYASRWVMDALEEAVEAANALVSCGLALNRQCLV